MIGTFFVNSKINDFISTKPKLLELQYPLHCTIYQFLNYDSYLCCSDLIKIDKTSLAQSICKGESMIKGNLIEEDLKKILNNVNKSKIFSEQEKNNFFK